MSTKKYVLPVLTVSVAECAHALGISERGARNLIARGEIPVVHLGGRQQVPVCWIEAQVAAAIAKWEQHTGRALPV